MIAKLKAWALAFAGAVIAIKVIFKLGEHSGKQKAKHHEAKRRLKSTQDMKDIQHDVSTQDDSHLINTLDGFVHK